MKGNSVPDKRTQASRSAATRAALIAAARPLFAEHGFVGVGTEAIVHAAGVTRGAMYHQFTDKTELFAAVFEVVEAEVTQRLDDVVSQAGTADPVELMQLGSAAWLDVSADPEVHRIALVEAPVVLGWERWREIGLRNGMGLVTGVLQYAIASGRMREQPVEPIAHVLISALDEAVLYIARSDDPARARREMGTVVEQLIAGITLPVPS